MIFCTVVHITVSSANVGETGICLSLSLKNLYQLSEMMCAASPITCYCHDLNYIPCL